MSGARRSSALAAGPDPLDEAKAAAMAANTLPEGVSSEDLRQVSVNFVARGRKSAPCNGISCCDSAQLPPLTSAHTTPGSFTR